MQGSIDYNNYNEVAKRLVVYRKDFRCLAREQLRIPTKPPLPKIVPLCPFLPAQEIALQSIERQLAEIGFIRHVILKQRQQGMSTLALAILFGMAGITPYTHTFTSTHDIETSEILFRTVRLFYESLHPAIRPRTRRSTVRQLVFEDEQFPEAGLRSSMAVDTAKKINMAIGRRLSALHFSEVARYEMVSNREQVKYALGAALGAVPLSNGTCVILESTAFVTGAFFKDACERAKRGEGAWRFVFVPWFVSNEYRVPTLPGERIIPTADERRLIKQFKLTPSQIKFRRFKIAEFHGDEALFMQDFATTDTEAWIVTGHSVFPPGDRRKLESHVCDPARFCEIVPGKGVIDVEGGPLWIWKIPDPEGEYDIAVDVAMDSDDEVEPGEGQSVRNEDEQDFSGIQVLRRGTLEQVAEWRGRVHPIELAELAATLGYYYNTAQIAPESKGIGVATTGHLSTVLRYPNIYRWRYRDRAVNALTKYQGWDTTPTSKQYLVAFATSVVRNRPPTEPLIHSKRLFAEIETFVRVGYGRYEAAADYKDDLCLVPETPVECTEGQIPLDLIIAGMEVLSHDGKFHRVKETKSRPYDGECVKIDACGIHNSIIATPEHPFLSFKPRRASNGSMWGYEKTTWKATNRPICQLWETPWNTSGEWKDARNLSIGDFLFVAKRIGLQPTELLPEELYLIGWYLGDGNLTPTGQLRIVCGIKEHASAEYLFSIVQRLCNEHKTTWRTGHGGKRSGGTTVRLKKVGNSWQVTACNKWLADFLTRHAGLARHKRLSFDLYNRSCLLPLAVGFLEAEGSSHNNRGCILASQKDETTLKQIRQILLDSGVWCTEPTIKRGNIHALCISGNWVNRLLIQYPGKRFDFIKRNATRIVAHETPTGYWTPIQKLERVHYSGKVANLEVDDSHSYISGGVVSHNCMAWMIALVTSNDEDYTRFLAGENAHEEKVIDEFYEPGKAPRRMDVDPAYTDADVNALVPLLGGTEVDGW